MGGQDGRELTPVRGFRQGQVVPDMAENRQRIREVRALVESLAYTKARQVADHLDQEIVMEAYAGEGADCLRICFAISVARLRMFGSLAPAARRSSVGSDRGLASLAMASSAWFCR